MPLHLTFEATAPGRDYHAALVVQWGGQEESWTPHTHDFWEAMYVLKGSGSHLINGEALPLKAGMLLLVRPHDLHAVHARAREELHFINVAFPMRLWRSFCRFAHLEPAFDRWHAAPSPPCATLSLAYRDTCADAFERALQAFVERPSRLDICHFWSAIVPFFSEGKDEATDKAPLWLSRALAAMRDDENLRLGLPRLVALSGVSPAHLSRTLKAVCGQTPTEFVNDLRLKRAATLLRTTSKEIIDLAFECGFSNLSYFYRRFRAHYGETPRAFRLDARADIVPQKRTRAQAKEREGSSTSTPPSGGFLVASTLLAPSSPRHLSKKASAVPEFLRVRPQRQEAGQGATTVTHPGSGSSLKRR